MPQDILHGMQVVQDQKGFFRLYSDLKIIYDLYEKFRLYQVHSLTSTKSDSLPNTRQISTYDMVDDILHDEINNVNLTLVNMFTRLYSSESKENIMWELYQVSVSPRSSLYFLIHAST